MAEYTNGGIFGDSSLFDDFESVPLNEPPRNKNEKEEEIPDSILKEKLTLLEHENERLKKLLRNLFPPRGLHVQNTESGPVAHVIFMNNDLSRKYRQEAEEFFEKLVARGVNNAKVHTSGMIDIDDDDDEEEEEGSVAKPQRSSRVIVDEGSEIQKEAYLATGNVQYYQVFCVDHIGRPLMKGDAQLTGWAIPIYTTIFLEPLPIDEKPQAARKARPKNKCWNCDGEDHSLRECPMQRDMARINANKQLFQSNSTPQQKRYVKDGKDSEGRGKVTQFVPGFISKELREAIGIRDDQMPPYIYMMRMHGYPPGWMREAEVESSGMKVYNIKKQEEEGEIDDNSEDHHDGNLKYDATKLVEYPGFNVPLPKDIKDEWQKLGAPPMQPQHSKELLEDYMTPPKKGKQEKGKKRRGSFMNDAETKKHKSERQEVDMDMSASDMDDLNTSTSSRGWFAGNSSGTFKPPLPPTPGAASPLPPLPLSTPPPTPDSPSRDSDDTPMPSPGSTAPLGLSADASQESSRSASPTVEDLQQQQEQLMKALMDAGESSMASDTDGGSGMITTDADSAEEGEVLTQNIEDSSQDSINRTDELRPPGAESEEILESPESPVGDGNTCNDESVDNRTEDVATDGPKTFKLHNPPELFKDLSGEGTPNKSGVPRLSNFATGITPHVDESLSESTGVFKKLLGILKTKGSKLK